MYHNNHSLLLIILLSITLTSWKTNESNIAAVSLAYLPKKLSSNNVMEMPVAILNCSA